MFNVVSIIMASSRTVRGDRLPSVLGWANWLIIPLAVIGAGVGMASRSTTGRNLNLFVIVVGIVRLMLGGGIL
jgi:hypothetical protein